MLCNRCSTITLDHLSITTWKTEPRGNAPLLRPLHDTYPSFPKLLSTATAGCQLCHSLRSLLLSSYKETPPQLITYVSNADKEWDGDDESFDLWDEGDNIVEGRGEWDGELEIEMVVRFLERRWDSVMFRVGKKDWVGQRTVTFAVQADDGSPAAIHGPIRRRPLSEDAISVRNIELSQKWIQECTQKHKYCDPNLEAELPTRVLDVGPGDGSQPPRLIITGGVKGRYVALSHCWGKPTPEHPHFTTETHTLKERMEGIRFESLPRNFQDAITVTRKLNLRYLWIDSLCIIQNSAADWKYEAARMDRVYVCAYLTISATSSSSTHEGFLKRPKPTHDIVKMPYQSPEDPSINGEYSLVSRYISRAHDIVDTSWNRRGWTMQERILSARILHFCKERLCFECRSSDYTEDNDLPNDTQQAYWLKGNPTQSKLWMHDNPSVEPERTYYLWYKMVRRYTEREFTNGGDRLPAILGLINEIKTVVEDDCYWGIWKGDFQRGLLWNLAAGEGSRDAKKHRLQNTPEARLRAPSWSWISVDGEIDWSLSPHAKFGLEVLDLGENPTSISSTAPATWRIKVKGKLKFLEKEMKDYDEGRELWILEVESENPDPRTWLKKGRSCLLLEACEGVEDTFERYGGTEVENDSKIFEDVEPRVLFLT